jgi:hypothetical protein
MAKLTHWLVDHARAGFDSQSGIYGIFCAFSLVVHFTASLFDSESFLQFDLVVTTKMIDSVVPKYLENADGRPLRSKSI